MNRKFLSATAATLALLPGLSLAEFNYTGIDVSWADVEIDVGPASVDGDGFAVGGAFTVGNSFFVGGSLADADFGFGIDGDITRIGGGYFHSLNEELDFVATLAYVDVEVGVGPFTAGDDGLALGGGVRTAVGESFEIDAMLEYVDFDSSGSDTGVELGGRYYLNDKIAVSAQTDLAKDVESLRIGIRFEF